MHLYPLRRLIVPLILIGLALLVRPELSTLEPVYQSLLMSLPYLTLGIAALLCVYFNRARLFTASVLGLVIYYVIQAELQTPLSDPRALFVYTATSLLLPVTILILALVPERGLRNRYGLVVFSVLPFIVITAFSLYEYFPETVRTAFIAAWLPLNPVTPYVLPVYSSAVYVLTALVFVWMLLKQDAEQHAASIALMFTGWITFARFDLDNISMVMLSVAGVILIISLLRSSYDMAYRDELTGLLGRRALNEKLKGLGRQYVIAMMDVDHFKKFNDTYGHDTGDDVLKVVARQIATVKGGGIPYRYGGEEFSIIFPGKEIDDCKPHLENVRKSIEAYQMVVRNTQHRPKSDKTAKERRGRRKSKRDTETVSVTISIGAAEPNAKHSKVEEVLKAADTALYKAKQNGRNCLAV